MPIDARGGNKKIVGKVDKSAKSCMRHGFLKACQLFRNPILRLLLYSLKNEQLPH